MDKKDMLSRIDNAIEKYAEKEAKKYAPKKPRKNKKPEGKTEKAIKEWSKKMGFELFRTEAKAKYNSGAGRFIASNDFEGGHSDFSGDTPQGVACYIEAKAKDRRSTITFKQHRFLTRKINRGCFAVIVDCVDKLDFFYKTWVLLRRENKPNKAKEFLLDMLPKKKFSKYTSDEF